MSNIIAAINMTLDGYCDHTAVNPDEALHEHYTTLLKNAGTILYGSITFKLMQYLLKDSSANMNLVRCG